MYIHIKFSEIQVEYDDMNGIYNALEIIGGKLFYFLGICPHYVLLEALSGGLSQTILPYAEVRNKTSGTRTILPISVINQP